PVASDERVLHADDIESAERAVWDSVGACESGEPGDELFRDIESVWEHHVAGVRAVQHGVRGSGEEPRVGRRSVHTGDRRVLLNGWDDAWGGADDDNQVCGRGRSGSALHSAGESGHGTAGITGWIADRRRVCGSGDDGNPAGSAACIAEFDADVDAGSE